jgi:two-component system sensor kinase FixL
MTLSTLVAPWSRVTPRKLRAAQRKELHYLYKFAELGQLSTALYHDLANSVAVLTLDLEALQRRRDSHALRRANDSLAHIDRLINEMRRQLNQASSVAHFNPRRIIREVAVGLKERFAGAHTTLRVINNAPPDALLHGDKARFAQVIGVLLTNALEATVQNAISIDENRVVTVELGVDGKHLYVTVSDWGGGVGPRVRDDIFKPFFGTKPAGMGVGLFITRQIIETHFKGEIELFNALNPTQFRVKLPLSKRGR